ncbi:hypothetical protein PUN28_019037 [Cardiocondyla obscurior]|uniref:Uncharacterized protein n=1 Tax=Cardiocondyla obscurior TaxID=286306 RepID=A0AAW2EF62_9HYME
MSSDPIRTGGRGRARGWTRWGREGKKKKLFWRRQISSLGRGQSPRALANNACRIAEDDDDDAVGAGPRRRQFSRFSGCALRPTSKAQLSPPFRLPPRDIFIRDDTYSYYFFVLFLGRD